jgi:hypothetical protein
MCPDATGTRERFTEASWDVAGTSSAKLTTGDGKDRELRGVLFAIALFALATHFLYFNHFHNYYVADSPSYITPALNLIHGNGFTGSDGRPETFRTPGYPLLIIPFLWASQDVEYLVIFQHLLQVFVAVATAAAALRVSRSRRQALIAGILLSIDLPTLESANLVLSETLFTITLAAVLWLLWSGSQIPERPLTGSLFLCGLLAGASVLIRPISLYFVLPASCYLFLTRKRSRFRTLLAFTAAFACLPLLWATRNYRETGRFTVSSVAGLEMMCCRAAGVLALDDPGDFNSNLAKRRVQLEDAACADLKTIYGRDCADISVTQKSDFFMQRARGILVRHPVAFLRLGVRGAAVMWLDGGPSSLQGFTGINQHSGIRLLLMYTVPALCLAFTGLWTLWKNNRQLCYLLLLTIGYFVVVSSGGDSYSRHRVPIVPLYVILTAAGIDSMLHLLASRRSSRTVAGK